MFFILMHAQLNSCFVHQAICKRFKQKSTSFILSVESVIHDFINIL